jgi:hypothetical protein
MCYITPAIQHLEARPMNTNVDVDRLAASSLKLDRAIDWSLGVAWVLVLGSVSVLLFY